jgi:hypothetical protein
MNWLGCDQGKAITSMAAVCVVLSLLGVLHWICRVYHPGGAKVCKRLVAVSSLEGGFDCNLPVAG